MDIGIDLGTTYSVIGVNGNVTLNPEYGEGIYIKECDVTIIPTPYAEQSFPSVAIEDPVYPGQLLFGTDALSVVNEDHSPIMFSKRKVGSDEILTSGSIKMTAMDFAAAFLEFLKKCAEQALDTAVERAVITHPAYFDRVAVEQTREAAVLAGFKMDLVDQMVMEPVAAALAYTRTDKRDPLNIITYDLGGGTFDVTVLQRDHGIIDMKAFDGNHLLGGYNFDRKLIDWLRKQLETRGRKIEIDLKTDTGKAAVANLLRAAEGVKIKLAKAVDDEKMIEFRARGVINDVNGKDVPINERLCRKDFVKMIAHYINRTIESCNSALKKTELNTGDIHEVLLVGGSSYAPWITEAIKPLFPHLTPGLFLPDLCVGIGAAIHGNIILPKQSTINDYLIQLDIPERTSIETVNIIGEINCSNTNQLQKASIILKSSAGKQLDKTNFDSELKFFFSNIELMVLDGKNEYTLQVVDTNQNIILSHSFCIEHETEGSDTSTISTVLPQPLFIETYDGLVAIAKEGVALPARITQTFKRLNNNTNFEILLYQKDEKIGVIRVEDMPLEGGKGAFLDLDLHITQKNEIKGKVIIRKDDNGFKAEKIISLKYSVIEIPDTDALTDEINQLKARIKGLSVNVLQTEKNELSAETINIALELIQEAEKLLGQIPLERNEIYDLLKKIANILQPPQDDMQPSRKEFNALLNQCRETCTKLIKSTKGIADDDDSGKGLDKSMVESAGKSVHQAKVFLKRIDEIESKGIEVANKKNKRNWQILNNKLQRIRADIQKNDKLQTPPTIYNKLLAKKRIIRMLQKFFNACNRIESDGKIKDWELELKAIYYDLITALLSIHDLDDFLLDDEGLTLIRRIYHDQITNREIPERIDKIGSVI